MGLGIGFYNAFLGDTSTAGSFAENRKAKQIKAMQQEMQMQQMQQKQSQDMAALQQQINIAEESAKGILYMNKNFARNKDVDDFENWHKTSSIYPKIKETLRKYGSVAKAKAYGDLDLMIEQYRQEIQDNPISKRANQNMNSLTAYQNLALTDDKKHLLSVNNRQRFQDYREGKTDEFYFSGELGDYVDLAQKSAYGDQNIDLEDLLNSNRMRIQTDMTMDLQLSSEEGAALQDDEMLAWLKKNTKHETFGETSYFNGKAVYGSKEFDTSFSQDILTNLASAKTFGDSGYSVVDGNSYFKMRDDGMTYDQMFGEYESMEWMTMGGVDHSQKMKSYIDDWSPFSKDTKMVGSSAIFVDPVYRQGVTESVFGNFEGTEESKYNPKTNMVSDVNTAGLYDKYGHKILGDDTVDDAEWNTLWNEAESMDLELLNYHVGLEGTNKKGESFLLTDVGNESDRDKLREQYGDVVFKQVVIAEMRDSDLGPDNDDYYYKKVNLADPNLQIKLNEKFNSEGRNKIKKDMLSTQTRLAEQQYFEGKKAANRTKLVARLNLPTDASLDQFVGAYDKTISVGLKTNNVSNKNIQTAMPLLMSQLYVESQQPRSYGKDGIAMKNTKDEVIGYAKNSSEYMAYRTKLFTEGLAEGKFEDMLNAINQGTGAFASYLEANNNKKDFKNIKQLTKDIIKHLN
jgi:hypothetical protein